MVGIGTVQIKAHDDIVRTLINVHHISNLKCNLISLGTLELNGFMYSTEGEVLKVSKDALVFMKGVRYGHLYILQGLTVIGFATVTTSSSNVV